MIVIRKLTLYLLVIIFVLAGCSKSVVESSTPKNNAPTLTPTNIPKELSINPDDKTSFFINGEMVKVTDETSSVNSITNLEWIDDSRIGIECHINPSLGYFTIYNIQTKQFEYSVYGTNFVWDKHDIQSLIYIDCPPHFGDIVDAKYRLKDYTDMTLFESSNELRDLEYENGAIRFTIIDKEENKTSKTITKKKIEEIKKQYNIYKK